MRTIAGLRADAGDMTQEELAKEMGVSVQTIRNWERQQQNLKGDIYIRLSKRFKVSTDELLGLK